MPYLLQLHVFSGRTDPVWQISDKEAADLFKGQKTEPQQLLEASAAAAAPGPAAGLGYRGFSLIETSRTHPEAGLVEGQLAPDDFGRSALIHGNSAVERLLLESGRRLLPRNVVETVVQAIDRPVRVGPIAASACPACHGATAPAYDPGYWNNDPTRLARNNCYNYANNQATNTFAQPGRATGHQYTSFQCNSVQPAAVSDGLQAAANFSANTPGWYVALVIWPGTDYHWYRQDKNGCWSHKPGSTQARNVDNSGHTITDPKTCNRGPYTVFCSYMTTRSGVRIR